LHQQPLADARFVPFFGEEAFPAQALGLRIPPPRALACNLHRE